MFHLTEIGVIVYTTNCVSDAGGSMNAFSGSSQSERQNLITELVLKNTSVSIQELAEMFQVSAMTIHRDLDELEQQGILRKVRGGATAQRTYLFESHLNYRMNACQSEKEAIAMAALAHVEPGEAVILDDSTTTLALAKKLVNISHLTVITNFFSSIEVLRGLSQINLIWLGGDFLYRYNAVVGDLCEAMIRSVRANTLFMSSSAVSEGYTFHQEEVIVRVKRAMIESASRRILMVDHTKLGKQALRQMVPLTAFDLVIVDSLSDPEEVEKIRDLGVPVEVVPIGKKVGSR